MPFRCSARRRYNGSAMNTAQTREYAVHLLQHASNGTERWQAFVEALPQITAEGETCEAVLQEIGQKLRLRLANGDRVPTAPASGEGELSSEELEKLEAQVQAQGHKYYGIFADDPGAMEVFDEIERQREEQT